MCIRDRVMARLESMAAYRSYVENSSGHLRKSDQTSLAPISVSYTHLDVYKRQIVDYMLTRRCAGGSGQHIIFDCRGNVIACSFIPEEAHLSAGKEIPQIEDRFKEVYRKVDRLFDRNLAERLKGECGTCGSKKSCMGGCLTMKIPLGLGPDDEQPV